MNNPRIIRILNTLHEGQKICLSCITKRQYFEITKKYIEENLPAMWEIKWDNYIGIVHKIYD